MQQHLNSFWDQGGYEIALSRTTANPRSIVALIDNSCASSTEQLLLVMKQSKKVTLMGANTAGVLDYSEVIQKDFPFLQLSLRYPSKRSNRLPARPVDNIGIAPDVPLTSNQDWISSAQLLLEKIGIKD